MALFFDADTPEDTLRDLGRLDMLIKAVETSRGIKEELTSPIPGVLQEYFLQIQAEAADAAAELIIANPTNATGILTHQKTCAAYAHLYAWLLERQRDGEKAEVEWTEMQRDNQETLA